MEQNIICKEGKCVDIDNLTCKERFSDPIELFECELLEES